MSGVTIERSGHVGYLTLAQPASLNALTMDMIDALHVGLKQHEKDAAVKLIILRSASDRAFCAGGDMKKIRQLALDNKTETINEFFTREYALNLAVAECSKPYISLIDGVAMGGGLGLSVHGTFRVVTDKAIMAMPESRIGFFPDVGGSYFLQQLPFSCGAWLALTAMAVRAQQCVITGLATHFVKHDKLPDLVEKMESLELPDDANAESHVRQLLDNTATKDTDEQFEDQLKKRAEWFDGDDVNVIRSRLTNATDNEDAQTLLAKLDSGSPHSYTITLELFKATRGMNLQQCLAAELELSKDACLHPDLAEGVRAVLVDKDHKPEWR